jgi:fructose-bisphosphate aldolase class 1
MIVVGGGETTRKGNENRSYCRSCDNVRWKLAVGYTRKRDAGVREARRKDKSKVTIKEVTCSGREG